MALTLHLAAFAAFVASGFAGGNDPSAPARVASRAAARPSSFIRQPAVTCRWQRDVATGRLSARWQT